MARSENNAVGNTTYADLNMSFYPAKIDSRNQVDTGFNTNMSGYENMKDYNMAEHVNALADAVMAIQRVLGINPQKDKDGQDNPDGTVGGRIKMLEDPTRLDERYGGVGWDLSQTIVAHTHSGGPGHPSPINLANEVQGLLAKINIDLSQSTGLTGSDLSMSPLKSTKLSDAISDKLSVTQGGTIHGNVSVNGSLQSRITKEWTAIDFQNGSIQSDVRSYSNIVATGSGTGEVRFMDGSVGPLLSGKYVLGVRAKISSLVSENVMKLYFADLGESWVGRNLKYIQGTDFYEADKWQMFYMVFDHETLTESGYNHLHIWKTTTSANVTLSIDNAFIMPVHPAVFDQ